VFVNGWVRSWQVDGGKVVNASHALFVDRIRCRSHLQSGEGGQFDEVDGADPNSVGLKPILVRNPNAAGLTIVPDFSPTKLVEEVGKEFPCRFLTSDFNKKGQ
jgi:hypothetical protein